MPRLSLFARSSARSAFFNELIGFVTVGWRDGDADAGPDHELMTVDVEGLADGGLNSPWPARRPCSAGLSLISSTANSSPPMRATMLTSRELFAQTFGDALQQRVADRVPERVVDLLEAVDVEHEEGQRLRVVVRAVKRVVHALAQLDAIGQICQRIVSRHVRDARFGTALLGDVLVRRNPAAVLHWLMLDRDDAPVLEFLDRGVRLCRQYFCQAFLDVMPADRRRNRCLCRRSTRRPAGIAFPVPPSPGAGGTC